MGGLLPPAERKSGALLGMYAALSLVLLITSEHLPAAALRGIGAWVFAPLDRVVLALDRAAEAWREGLRLEQRVTELELENARLRGAAVENRELRQQMELPSWRGEALRPVEILALSGEPVPHAAVTSAGRRQGVQVGDVVVTRDGLLGRIVEVYPSLSRVALLTDFNSAVACEIESTGVLGVLHFVAAPRPRLLLTGVPLSDTVRLRQRVLTSGLSRRYPRGIPVGAIVRISRDPSGLLQDLEVSPAARLSRLRHGFVLPGPRPLEGQP
jgi:rod shape-determining protein MreC